MKLSEYRYSNCLYFTSNALARKMEGMAIESFKPVELNPSLALLLILAIENPGIQPGRVSEQLQLTPSTITRLIEKLEKRKLLVRIFESKATNIYPTANAKKISSILYQCVENFNASYQKILGIEESKKLLKDICNTIGKLKE
ncbi:MAG: MarR family winged helix-turn-helix transcriptional regulator [Niabella sp.]